MAFLLLKSGVYDESQGERMGANDVIALKANFDSWQADRMPGLTGVDPFEYYCVDQFLKPFDVSDDELRAGLVGGGNDGGADSVHFFVNRRLVQDDTKLDPKTTLKVNLLIMQVKQTQGFSPNEINKLVFFTDDFLDLSRQPSDYKTTYNANVLEVLRIFKKQYQQIAGAFPSVFIDYYYITQADQTENVDAKGAADRVIQKAKEHLNTATCNFHFVNAQKLWTQVQLRIPKSKTLHWQDTPLGTPEGFVGLVKLHDYWTFLKAGCPAANRGQSVHDSWRCSSQIDLGRWIGHSTRREDEGGGDLDRTVGTNPDLAD